MALTGRSRIVGATTVVLVVVGAVLVGIVVRVTLGRVGSARGIVFVSVAVVSGLG